MSLPYDSTVFFFFSLIISIVSPFQNKSGRNSGHTYDLISPMLAKYIRFRWIVLPIDMRLYWYWAVKNIRLTLFMTCGKSRWWETSKFICQIFRKKISISGPLGCNSDVCSRIYQSCTNDPNSSLAICSVSLSSRLPLSEYWCYDKGEHSSEIFSASWVQIRVVS